MNPQELKNSILQLAIQGKLVEQRPEEGTGQDLYKQIQAEKQKLIKAGKIKKEKPLPEISDDEKPFDIPESWKWVRLKDICTKIVDGDHNPPTGVSYRTDYLMLSAQNINNDQIVDLDKTRYLSAMDFEKANQRTNVKTDDILFTIVGTLGRSCVYKGGYNLSFQRSVSVLHTLAYNYFLKYVLDTPFIQNFMIRNATGTAQKGFYLNQVESLVLPLPPLFEQKRIADKIIELLPYIDRYEQAWSKLEDFNKRFPTDLQKSILQMAIQGKLVAQRPEEGTGEELYQQIQAEKQTLIKVGKIKKEKPLPEIPDDEKPFDIPESWKWVRFGEAISLLSGTDFKPEEYNAARKGSPYVTGASSLSFDGVLINRWTETPRVIATLGDVLLVCKGSGYGKVVICDVEEAHIARQIMAIKKINSLYMRYIQLFLEANIRIIKSNGQGVIPGIDRGSVLNMTFPLPPIAEQKRIVAKIEEMLLLSERLRC